ncbi:SDR family NAD(P)-dependent oxidoreductase [Pontixanthobacter aquaemixtae]|uniref:SDR family NAD(P)-dependent oxidoreductase n=1 Tax=Pontixanthobacter aquaemixtae TaxID=1958940 RepID=A0A844ZT60_9SPHN|nr:SDR family NAD(P)-dependent oxidoreductase [Pontixanthobacter aquaemixtae]MXO91093.1 SDR family NAD(P)-dependent oxidoreductase [Pontixanthobacter aquaemixtae]
MAKTDIIEGKLVVMTGGSGFLGSRIAQALLERGARLRIASRNPERAFTLKPLADLGQLQFARCDIRNERDVAAVMQGADLVINLVGGFKGDLVELIGEGAGNVARAAKDAGAAAMVHISAIGADAESDAEYARAKALSENEVLAAFPKASIIRPSMLFGDDDQFINMLAGLISTFPALPVFAPQSPLQMLWVDDAADAVIAALANPAKHGGKIFEIGGPEAITMLDLHRRIAKAQGRDPLLIETPDFASAIFAALPLTPMGRDQWILLKAGNVPSGDYPGLKQLGIEPKPLGLFLDRWMVQYRKYGRFNSEAKTSH